MTQIAKFQVKQLHGYRNLDIRLEDNTLILVGENGSGKTTILQLLYYLLSGQWGSMTGYEFESIEIDIDGTSHAVRHAEIKKHSAKLIGGSRVDFLRMSDSASSFFLSA